MNLPVFLMAGSSEPASLYIVSTLLVGKKSDLSGEFLRFFCGIMILLKRPNWTYLFVQKVLTKHRLSGKQGRNRQRRSFPPSSLKRMVLKAKPEERGQERNIVFLFRCLLREGYTASNSLLNMVKIDLLYPSNSTQVIRLT